MKHLIVAIVCLCASGAHAGEPVLRSDQIREVGTLLKIINDQPIDLPAVTILANQLIRLADKLGPNGRPHPRVREHEILNDLRAVAATFFPVMGRPMIRSLLNVPGIDQPAIERFFASIMTGQDSGDFDDQDIRKVVRAYETSPVPAMQNQIFLLLAATMTTNQLTRLANVDIAFIGKLNDESRSLEKYCETSLSATATMALLEARLSNFITGAMLQSLIEHRGDAMRLAQRLR